MTSVLDFASAAPAAELVPRNGQDLRWDLHLASLDWTSVRRPPAVCDYELGEQASHWLAALPPEVRPQALANRHPYIVNRMAALQDQPCALQEYFDSLLHDRRGGRRGFSQEVAHDLARLHRHALRSWALRPALLRSDAQAA